MRIHKIIISIELLLIGIPVGLLALIGAYVNIYSMLNYFSYSPLKYGVAIGLSIICALAVFSLLYLIVILLFNLSTKVAVKKYSLFFSACGAVIASLSIILYMIVNTLRYTDISGLLSLPIVNGLYFLSVSFIYGAPLLIPYFHLMYIIRKNRLTTL